MFIDISILPLTWILQSQ